MKRKNLKLTVLTMDEAEKRYINLQDTGMAYLTRKALDNNYLIAILEYKNLSKETNFEWTSNAKIAIAHKLHTSLDNVDFFGFTDLSESMNDKLYLAFKKRVDACFSNSSSARFI